MAKMKANKAVVEQITSKLKITSNVVNLAENDNKSDLETENSKLQANKNIFARGDFDEYKISDEELAEHERDIEKGLHKYISKKFENGKWVYKYHQDRKQAVKNLLSCSATLLKCNINNAKAEGEKFIKDWNIDWSNNPNKSKSSVLGKHISIIVKDVNGNYGISLIHFAHKGSKKNQPRDPNEILMRAKLLPIAKEMLENKNKATVYEVRNDGNYVEYSLVGKFIQNGKEKKVCVIISKNKKEGNVYLSVMRKAISHDNDIAFITDVFLLKPSKDVQFSAEQRAYSSRPFPNRDSILSYSQNMSTKINKSLTYSGHKLQDRTSFAGMNISIENKKGSYREGVDGDGHKWRTYMNYDYGYIRGTEGTDGDHIDCYLGPDKESKKVFVIHQNNPVTHKYDEDKCMLCFSSADEAKKAYMKQYDRPGFFGSMDTMTIDEFKTYVFSQHNKGKRIHKSFEMVISGITENNKAMKIEQAQKAMTAYYNNQSFIVKHIPADDSQKFSNITLKISDFNKLSIEKAVRKMSFTLDEPIGVACGEAFVYKSQEDLTSLITKEITSKTKQVYQFMIDYFDLPEMRIVQKSKLKYKGQIIYNPETGEAISKSEWRKFVKALKEFMDKLYENTGEKIVINSQVLGRILQKMSKTHSFDKIRKVALADIEKPHRNFDWISNTARNMTDVLGNELPRYRQARVQAAIDSAAQRVTKITDTMRNDMQQIIIDGVKDRKSKSKVSQELFDKCVGLNRDFQRIADTEIQNNTTSAYIHEEFYNSKEGEKVYFKRFEVIDGNTCKHCKEIKDTIALYSDIPLESENIKDEYADIAIWEGKKDGVPFGVFHPWCRGSWYRYYPELD